MMTKIMNIIKTTGIIVLTLFLVMVVFQRLFPQKSGFLGLKTFVIVSRSMEPKLKIGDIILVKETEPSKVKINDMVTYQGDDGSFKDKTITHQVKNIQIENNRYIFHTKGLSNTAMDPAVYEEQLYGKVVYRFILLSVVSRIIRNPIGFILGVLLPLSILFVTEIMDIKKEINERRK